MKFSELLILMMLAASAVGVVVFCVLLVLGVEV
jgi:hypothetical protein